MQRILLVTYRTPDQGGGPAARWRSMVRHLPSFGIEVDVVSASASGGAADFGTAKGEQRAAKRRARVMRQVGRAVDPAFRIAGLRPEALPPSTVWAARGAREIRRRLARQDYAAVVSTGPPWAALLAARAARVDVPLIVELRDLWARNPLFDRGGAVLPALERRVLSMASAVVLVTDEALTDISTRHPSLPRERFVMIPNGFEDELLALRHSSPTPKPPLTILHSGSLTPDRPLTPLLSALCAPSVRGKYRLILNGVIAPAIHAQIERFDADVTIEPPSDWRTAIEQIAQCDIALITQSQSAGDQTAIAGKAYEYAALGKRILCLSDGGATESLLRRLGADDLCARLAEPASIQSALEHALVSAAGPVPEAALAQYKRSVLAGRMAELISQRAR